MNIFRRLIRLKLTSKSQQKISQYEPQAGLPHTLSPSIRPSFLSLSATTLFSLSKVIALLGGASVAVAGEFEQAKRMHERIVGAPPTEAVLQSMATNIASGNGVQAAFTAMDDPRFYSVTLKNWATPWTNRDQDIFRPLNDYTATVIGVVRDELDFRTLLYDNLLYVGASSTGVSAYSNSNNAHYEQLEERNVNLIENLERRTQSDVTGLPAGATAGVITSRGGARAFFYAGTNRAMLRFTLLNHLCNDLEQVHDVTLPPDRIRQDVSRSPGGDSRVFLNNCVGCHSGMDPLAQAFAYYSWDYDPDTDPEGDAGQITYNREGDIDPETGTRVQEKYRINANTFPYGYVTPDDNWDNYWRIGANSLLGWDQSLPGSGSGAKSLGMELAHSEAFASCQVEKVFQMVCLREPGNNADRAQVEGMVTSFENSGYNLKQVVAESADYCKGE
ncbi:hypothetical protein [Marinibactrum halimedae]|nr:hypothetical protein [Marinibactrum halimedae]MCD9457780.1 hypothetical protein [Marinibactrum halimedae]